MNKFICVSLLFLVSLGLASAQAKSPAISKYQEAMQALDRDLPHDAIVLLREAVALNPQYLDALIALASAYYSLDEYDEALRYVKLASPLGKDSAKVLTMHGRILLALGKLDEANAILKSVVKREPYNIEALLGLAEFSLAKGDAITALSQYTKSLDYNASDRRILLSLAVMYEDRGLKGDIASKKKSEDFMLKALDRYPESPMVQTMAAEYYLRSGRLNDAYFHAGTARSLNPNYQRALLVLARTLILQSNFTEALSVVDQITKIDSKNTQAYFLYAIAQKSLNQNDLAIAGLERLLLIDPSDEVSRIFLESLILGLPIDSELRARHAQFHLDQALQYKKKNLLSRAGFHYNRARQLAPNLISARRGYAEYLKATSQNARFLQEIKVLKSMGVDDSFVNDNIEIYTSLLQTSVAVKWKIDQFAIDRDPIVLRIFYSPMQLDHTLSSSMIAQYLQNQIGSSDKVSFGTQNDEYALAPPREVQNLSDPYRMARDERADYYVVTQIAESGDNFMINADLYLARTGNKIKSFQAYRSGNFRVQNAMVSIAEQIQAVIPLRGTLKDRKVNDGLINLGSVDGVKSGDVLEIVSPNGYLLQGELPGFAYSADKKVGELTITKVGDLVSEGTIKRIGITDRINTGDAILKASELGLKATDATGNFPLLYNRIRGIR